MSKNYVENLKREFSELKVTNQKLLEEIGSLKNLVNDKNNTIDNLQSQIKDIDNEKENSQQKQVSEPKCNSLIYSLYTSEEKDEMLENDKRQITDLYNDVFQRDKVISEFMDIQKNIAESIIKKIESMFDNRSPVITENKEKSESDSEQRQVAKEPSEQSNPESQITPVDAQSATTDTDNKIESRTEEQKSIKERTACMTVEGMYLTFIAYDNNTFILKDNTTGQETDFTKQLLIVLRFTSLSLNQLKTVIKDIIDFKKVYVGYKYLVLKEKLQSNNKKEYKFESISRNEYDEEQAYKKNDESNN